MTPAFSVEISIPKGKELASKTFNPRLGIVGGISVLGTSGIVEPMSESAIIETIRTEIRQRRAEGKKRIAVVPGNYGENFLHNTFGTDFRSMVQCSNFVGETLDMLAKEGFEEILLVGHIGKLVKLAGVCFRRIPPTAIAGRRSLRHMRRRKESVRRTHRCFWPAPRQRMALRS